MLNLPTPAPDGTLDEAGTERSPPGRAECRAVVEANCVECHTGTIAGTFLDVHHGKEHGTLDTLKLLVAPRSEAEGPRCSTCHSDVGHVLR